VFLNSCLNFSIIIIKHVNEKNLFCKWKKISLSEIISIKRKQLLEEFRQEHAAIYPDMSIEIINGIDI